VGTHGLHLLGDLSRVNDYVPTATRLQLRKNIVNPVPVNASLVYRFSELYPYY